MPLPCARSFPWRGFAATVVPAEASGARVTKACRVRSSSAQGRGPGLRPGPLPVPSTSHSSGFFELWHLKKAVASVVSPPPSHVADLGPARFSRLLSELRSLPRGLTLSMSSLGRFPIRHMITMSG